jgi:NTE family protein
MDEDAIRNNRVKCGIVHTKGLFKYQGCKVDDIPYGELKTYLIASCSAHPFLKKTIINGKKVRDGWFSDNVPVNLALELGAEKIFAIDIMWGINKKVAKDVNIYYLRPSKKMKFFLNFSNDVVNEAIKLGYNDVMNKKDEILNFINS